MTSKEAIQSILNFGGYDYWKYTKLKECTDVIESDLDKLEQLEKQIKELKESIEKLKNLEEFNKLLMNKYVPLDLLSPTFWNSKENWLEYMDYNYYLFLCHDYNDYNVKDNIRLTSKEFNFVYKILKDWLMDNYKEYKRNMNY